MRALYAARRSVLVEALLEHTPPAALGGLAAGFHAVVHLRADADEQDVIARARERSIGLYGMSAYRSDGATVPPQLVVGFGNVGEGAIRRGIAAVGDLL